MSHCLVIAKKNLRKKLQAVVQDYQMKRLTFKSISFQYRTIVIFEMFHVSMVWLEEENQKENNFERRSFHEFLIFFKFLRKFFPQDLFLFCNFDSQKIVLTIFFRFQPFNFCRNNYVNLKHKMNFQPNYFFWKE